MKAVRGENRLPLRERDYFYDDEMALELGDALNTLHKKISLKKKDAEGEVVDLPPYKLVAGKRRWYKVPYYAWVDSKPDNTIRPRKLSVVKGAEE